MRSGCLQEGNVLVMGYDSGPVRDAHNELSRLSTEETETRSLHDRLRVEIEDIQKSASLDDKDALAALQTKQLQMTLCPKRIEQIERRRSELIRILEEALPALVRCAMACITPSIEGQDVAFFSAVRPFMDTDWSAEQLAKTVSDTRKRLIGRMNELSICTLGPISASRRALDIIDDFNTHGKVTCRPAPVSSKQN